MFYIWIALTLYCMLLQYFDAYTTYIILQAGGTEVNPVMNYIFNRLGLLKGLIISKTAACILIIFIYFQLAYLLVIVAGLYTLVVIHNYKQMQR